jgi:hypothetical protein
MFIGGYGLICDKFINVLASAVTVLPHIESLLFVVA